MISAFPPSLPGSEDVLWSALFALAVVARDTSDQFVSHMLVLVQAGVLPALEHALASYRQMVDEQVGSRCSYTVRPVLILSSTGVLPADVACWSMAGRHGAARLGHAACAGTAVPALLAYLVRHVFSIHSCAARPPTPWSRSRSPMK